MFWLGFACGMLALMGLFAAFVAWASGRPYMPGPFARPDWEHLEP